MDVCEPDAINAAILASPSNDCLVLADRMIIEILELAQNATFRSGHPPKDPTCSEPFHQLRRKGSAEAAYNEARHKA